MPLNPQIDDLFVNAEGHLFKWTGTKWVHINEPFTLIPTEKQLEEHESLRHAWNAYLVVRKLIGI